jgi:hypothetical protein
MQSLKFKLAVTFPSLEILSFFHGMFPLSLRLSAINKLRSKPHTTLLAEAPRKNLPDEIPSN